MSVEQLEDQISRLPRENLARLAGWFDRFLGRAIPDAADLSPNLSEAEREELLRRRDQMLADPGLVQPMNECYFDGLKRELADARVRKASGR